MNMREKAQHAVEAEARQASIYQHYPEARALYAMPDGTVHWEEGNSNNLSIVPDGTLRFAAVAYRTEIRQFPCTCVFCEAGYDPKIWAGDYEDEVMQQLTENLAAIGFGYFNDEKQGG